MITTEESNIRMEKLRKLLEVEGVDAVLISTRPNSFYFSSFSSSNSLLVVTPDRAVFLTDFRYLSKAHTEISHMEVHDLAGADLGVIVGRTPSIGYEGDFSHQGIEDLKRRLPKRKFKNLGPALRSIRNVKSASEIKQISSNQKLTEKILAAVLHDVHIGVSEATLRAKIRLLQIAEDADEAFESIVAVGANSANPHAIAGRGKITRNKFLLIDLGTRRNYYHSDMTRTFAVGQASPKAREIYQVVLEAQMAALAAIRPGVEGRFVDSVARDIISKAGYGDFFGHGLGHGVGLEIHEGPTLRRESTDVLEEGMVVTVEPGIYLPGFGGVRIEDTVVVTSRGIRNLNSMPKTFRIL